MRTSITTRQPLAATFILVVFLSQGCSTESTVDRPGDAGIDSQQVTWRDKYRFKRTGGREQFDITKLVADLKGDNSKIRIAAAKVIPYQAQQQFEPALSPLIVMLGSDIQSEKQAAAEGISHLAFRSTLLSTAFEPLRQIIESHDSEETRRWATVALADIGPFLPDEQQMKLVELLKTTINDTSYDIARFAMDGLANLGPRSESAIPAIFVQLDAGKHRTLIATHTLKKIHCRPDLCVPRLITAMGQTPEWTEYILQALGEFGVDAAPAVPTIRKSLASRDGNVLIAAACALAAIGPAADSAAVDLQRAFESRRDAPGVIKDEARIALFDALNSIGPKGKARASEILERIHGLRLVKDSRLPIHPERILGDVSNSLTITTLLLSGSELSDQDLAPIASLVNLEELAMPQSATNECFRHIAGLSKLRILKQDLWNTGDSRGNILDDSAMVHLQNCSRLQSLTLRIRLSASPNLNRHRRNFLQRDSVFYSKNCVIGP